MIYEVKICWFQLLKHEYFQCFILIMWQKIESNWYEDIKKAFKDLILSLVKQLLVIITLLSIILEKGSIN